jgi:phosphohistidine phosphatase SixA
MGKTLIILRHAHRDKDAGSRSDNGLSAKGKKQAKAAAAFFKSRFGLDPDSKPLLFSSPKKRCQETLEPLARKLETQAEILPCLNEARTATELEQNVADFRYFWDQHPAPLIVICSHGDWIPRFLEATTGSPISLAKGGWAQLERDEWHQKPRLTWLIQDF